MFSRTSRRFISNVCNDIIVLQSNQVKRTPLDSINESVILKLNPLVVSSIQIKIRFLIGLYEQCMKPENQKTRKPTGKTPLNIFRAAILDLYNSGFSKKQISRDLQQSMHTVRKKICHFKPGTV